MNPAAMQKAMVKTTPGEIILFASIIHPVEVYPNPGHGDDISIAFYNGVGPEHFIILIIIDRPAPDFKDDIYNLPGKGRKIN